jgi:hypothetical protein
MPSRDAARAVGLDQSGSDDLAERASAADMTEVASDVGPAPLQVGAVLVFGPGTCVAASEVLGALADRVRGIP